MVLHNQRTFSSDERIAWANIPIPVVNGETSDEWHQLSGKQGDDKEGWVHVILTVSALLVTGWD